MPTLEATMADIEMDARVLMCGILAAHDRGIPTLTARGLTQLHGYKKAREKGPTVMWLLLHEWLRYTETESRSRNPNMHLRSYQATELGRLAVEVPEPQPEIEIGQPIPFPDDPVESIIYGHHLGFFREHGWWPNGTERKNAFGSKTTRQYNVERRRQAYANLVENGTYVRVTFRSGRGDSMYYVMPRISPQFAGKDGWVFYAPTYAI